MHQKSIKTKLYLLKVYHWMKFNQIHSIKFTSNLFTMGIRNIHFQILSCNAWILESRKSILCLFSFTTAFLFATAFWRSAVAFLSPQHAVGRHFVAASFPLLRMYRLCGNSLFLLILGWCQMQKKGRWSN